MSLVAYDNSSDESDYDEENNEEIKPTVTAKEVPSSSKPSNPVATDVVPKLTTNGHISDDDEDYLDHSEDQLKTSTFSLSLPKPKQESSIQELVGSLSTFSVLPTPKTLGHQQETIEEEDDEFLHKKDNFVSSEVKPAPAKGPVKISIPSLKDFDDVKSEMKEKSKHTASNEGKGKAKGCGLLSILPQAKSERTFSKESTDVATNESRPAVSKSSSSLIPDTVKYRRPAHNTEGIDGDNAMKKINPQPKTKTPTITREEDEEEDDDRNTASGSDFFSLQTDDDIKLPDVSVNEISMLVAKKAAKMAEVTNKYLKECETKAAQEQEDVHRNQQELEAARKRYHESQLDSEATQALVGSSAKRRRNEPINIVELNSEQILPNKDEWMRTALASSTTYQPTGVLVDEEPVAGTRRKHQITYLAHKAKANEAELQAMWAANRQNRRATQSKYGF
uniref:Mitotic checkpoint protein PRCC n=1 Tax=Musca domestica TaxID=7370 RepID=T1PDY4_MUSDO